MEKKAHQLLAPEPTPCRHTLGCQEDPNRKAFHPDPDEHAVLFPPVAATIRFWLWHCLVTLTPAQKRDLGERRKPGGKWFGATLLEEPRQKPLLPALLCTRS